MNPLPRLTALARSIRSDGRLLLTFLGLAIVALAFLKFASEVVEGDTMAFDRWAMLALRHPDASFRHRRVEQVLPVVGRVLPALEESLG